MWCRPHNWDSDSPMRLFGGVSVRKKSTVFSQVFSHLAPGNQFGISIADNYNVKIKKSMA